MGCLITIILLCFFLVPGVIYILWCWQKGNVVCPACNANSMIGSKSPRGRDLCIQNYGIDPLKTSNQNKQIAFLIPSYLKQIAYHVPCIVIITLAFFIASTGFLLCSVFTLLSGLLAVPYIRTTIINKTKYINGPALTILSVSLYLISVLLMDTPR